MIKSPIQTVTDKLQYRAIGIVNGIYSPLEKNQLNRGTITDIQGKKIETVVLGKALALVKKYISLQKSHLWIVYPKNKNTQNLHLQVVGIWDPYKFNNIADNPSKKEPLDLLKQLNLNDNYFSIRGELIYVNTQKKEFVIKICSSQKSKKLKNNNFKLVIEGELSLEILNNFVSLNVTREGNTLRLVNYEVIEKVHSKK
ncbi:MAG: hypothetical protein CMD04_00705 [Flavobacteriales bacterium]|nr:hypothetical protein [Flavobacteriales bacterium]